MPHSKYGLPIQMKQEQINTLQIIIFSYHPLHVEPKNTAPSAVGCQYLSLLVAEEHQKVITFELLQKENVQHLISATY